MDQLDGHGQPLLKAFNRSQRAERDISELLGLLKGMLADGVVNAAEAAFLHEWVDSHPDAADQWPMSVLIARLDHIFADGVIDAAEQDDLKDLLSSIVGGQTGAVLGHDLTTALPLDDPPPQIQWTGSVFVLTGKFVFGPRDACEREVVKLGGRCESSVTLRTNYLVLGTFASRDWVQTSYGRKIERAVELRTSGRSIAIVGEDHWAELRAA